MATALKDKEVIISTYKNNNGKIQTTANKQTEDLKRQLENLDEKYQIVTNSTSWKMTKLLTCNIRFDQKNY